MLAARACTAGRSRTRLKSRTAGRPGLRWTGPRRRVLEQLIAAATPVKPYELIAGYAPGAAPPKPPTVYRALDFLEREGLVHRVASLGAYVACAVEGEHGAAFLVCSCCNRIEEFRPAGDPAIAAAARQHGFLPAAVTLEVRGVCADCR